MINCFPDDAILHIAGWSISLLKCDLEVEVTASRKATLEPTVDTITSAIWTYYSNRKQREVASVCSITHSLAQPPAVGGGACCELSTTLFIEPFLSRSFPL